MCKSNVPYLLEPIIDDGDINEHNSLARYVNQAIPYNKFSSNVFGNCFMYFYLQCDDTKTYFA